MRADDIIRRIDDNGEFIGNYYKVMHLKRSLVICEKLTGKPIKHYIGLLKSESKKVPIVFIRLSKINYNYVKHDGKILRHSINETWETLFDSNVVCIQQSNGKEGMYYQIKLVTRCLKTFNKRKVTDANCYIKLELGERLF